MTPILRRSCSLAAVLLAAKTLFAQEFTVTLLDPPDVDGEVQAINAHGDVVGMVSEEMFGAPQPFVWHNGVFTLLPLDEASSGDAMGINIHGDVVGSVPFEAALWRLDPGRYALDGILPQPHSWANDINDAGQIVGFWANYGGFLWQDGKAVELVDISEARAINEAGDITGDTRVPETSAPHAAIYTEGRLFDTGTLGGQASRGYDINAHGDVVGSSEIDSTSATRAFLYLDGRMSDLGAMGGAGSSAWAINDHRWVVGSFDPTPGGHRAFLWRDGEMVDLNALVPLSTRTMFNALDVNNAGQIVVNLNSGLTSATRSAALLTPVAIDCNANGVQDGLDIVRGNSADCNENKIPDDCEADCNANRVHDACDIDSGRSADCNGNGQPDECELAQAGLRLPRIPAAGGLAIHGALPDEASGYTVAGVGDVNGDGIDDALIGSGLRVDCPDLPAEFNGGDSYVVFGRQDLDAADLAGLGALDGSNGFIIRREGQAPGQVSHVAPAGDVNGDGLRDVLIGAPRFDANGESLAGRAYLVFGGSDLAADGELDLATLDGTQGVVIDGAGEFEDLGTSVNEAGDVDGDGYGDVLIGTDANLAYLVFGGAAPWPVTIDLTDLASKGPTGHRGAVLRLPNIAGDLGFSVAPVGDFNGDGLDDFAVSARSEGAGVAYLLYGRHGPWPAELFVQAMPNTERLRIIGEHDNGNAGYSISGGSDVNGDGLDDVIIGAPLVENRGAGPTAYGETYVVFGRPDAPGVFFLSQLDGSNGFAIPGLTNFETLGATVAALEDFNADGFGDLIISESAVRLIGGNSVVGIGADTYLVFGHAGIGADGELDLAALDGASGMVITGAREIDQAGRALASAGDLNHDGVEDLLIGVPGALGPFCGAAARGLTTVLFGRPPDLDQNGVPDECEVQLMATQPPDGAIDAAVPYRALGGGGALLGWDVLQWTFDQPLLGVSAGDFAVNSSSEEAPTIERVDAHDGGLELTLNQPIPVGHCTTVRHVPSDTGISLGFLPADANGDATANQVDILALIDHLNGVLDPPLHPWQCDIDRSEQCRPADILMLIDLLNGAGFQGVWLGATLPQCP